MGLLDILRGESRETRVLREQAEQAEYAFRVKAAEAQARIFGEATHSPWGDYIDPRERQRDDPDGFASPLYHDRRDGANGPVFATLADLLLIQDRARWLADSDPVAIGVLDNLESFTVGEGFTYRATTKDAESAGLVAQVQDFLDEFLDLNDLGEREQETVRRTERDGECFLRGFVDESGMTTLRFVEPEHVTEPADVDKFTRFGILHRTDPCPDVETPLAYFVRYDPEDPGEWVPAMGTPEADAGGTWVYHVRRYTDRNVKRGLSAFYPTETGLRNVAKLLQNAAVGESVRAAIVGFWEYASASSATVSNLIGTSRDTGRTNATDPTTGKAPNYQRYQAGSIIHGPASKKFIAPPTSPNAVSQKEVLQSVLRAGVGVRWAMPEYMVSGSAENANYSSTLVAGSPFARRTRRAQAFYKRRTSRVAWAALRAAARVGRFEGYSWEAVESLVEIQVEAQDPEVADQLAQATIDHADMDRGVLSAQTRRQKRGLDSEQEAKNLADKPPSLVGPTPTLPDGVPGTPPVTEGVRFFPRVRRA